ncbi:GMC oxidoreductase [Sphingobium xenophagum]|nr:GMC oxidoreductase [Sphingobium xenophagum]
MKYNTLVGKCVAGLSYLFSRRGPVSRNGLEALAFIKSRPDLTNPDVQCHLFMLLMDEFYLKSPRHGFSLQMNISRPESCGYVSLRSSDPAAPPAMYANYLTAEADMVVLRESIRVSRRILAQPAFAPLVDREIGPGPEVRSDDELDAYIRETASPTYQMAGTCKMGDDDMAVVDSSLRVHGIDGLRVADASIMPLLVSGNTNAPVIMIAEKASDMVLGRLPLARDH